MTKDLEKFGYVFTRASKATVNITEENGKYVSDKNYVIFDVTPAVDNSDKTTRVVYCDAFTGDVVDEGIVTYAYHTIFNIDNLDCPEGYDHYQYELKSRNDAITKLLYIDGKWYPADSEIVLLIEKLL